MTRSERRSERRAAKRNPAAKAARRKAYQRRMQGNADRLANMREHRIDDPAYRLTAAG